MYLVRFRYSEFSRFFLQKIFKNFTKFLFGFIGCEGKAGMAAIVGSHHSVDLPALSRDLAKTLPHYARPLFIRMLENIETTGKWLPSKFPKFRNFFPNDISIY